MGLKHRVRQQVVDCVIEGRTKRFTRVEMLALIQARTGQSLTMRSLDSYIRAIKDKAPERLKELRESRTAFIDEVFKSLDGIERLIQEAWSLYHRNPNNGQLQLNCLHEIHQFEVTRSNIVDIIPAYGSKNGGMMSTQNGNTEKTALLSNLDTVQQRGREQAVF